MQIFTIWSSKNIRISRNAAVIRKRTTAVYAEDDRDLLFKCVS